jgi:hypothetical protein
MAGERALGALEALADRVMMAALDWYELLSVQLGPRFGCYERLADRPLTADELAGGVGIAPRYAEEWLEQHARSSPKTVWCWWETWPTLERLVTDAGFATITPLDVAHDKWRFWALRP